jgi:hypothetical protein
MHQHCKLAGCHSDNTVYFRGHCVAHRLCGLGSFSSYGTGKAYGSKFPCSLVSFPFRCLPSSSANDSVEMLETGFCRGIRYDNGGGEFKTRSSGRS